MSDFRFDGRVAVVTGAGRGLGRAYALLLAQRGAKVVVNDLGGSTLGQGNDPGPADEVVREIQAAGGTAVANYGDVSTADGGKSVVETAVRELGGIDILVNNAGNMVWASVSGATIETIDAQWAVHVRGTYNTWYAAWPHFREKNYGRVVLTSSTGMFGQADNIGYATAKASFIGMANSLTFGRGDANININCIAPNAVTRLGSRPGEKALELMPAMDPALVAPMVAYLSHESCNVSGQVFIAGAGRFARMFLGVTEGYLQPDLAKVTVEDVASNWAAINDEACYYVPAKTKDWAERFLRHLQSES